MTNSDFWDNEIHDSLFRVLPEILTMFLSLKPFPQHKHVFKFGTGRKPEASLLFSTVLVWTRVYPLHSLQPGSHEAARMFLSHLGGGRVLTWGFFSKSRLGYNVNRNEKAAYQIGMTWKERREKGITAVNSTQMLQEFRSCNRSGKIITEGSTETEETKIYSNAAAIWHS